MATSIRTIEAFLSHRRFALIGVSRNPNDLSRVVMRELIAHGFEVIPVSTHGDTVDGVPVHRCIADIPNRSAVPVDGAIVMVPAADAAQVVRDCVAAGIPRVWLHRGVGVGSCSAEATAIARQHGLVFVDGECPMMFLGGGIHAAHGAIRRLSGRYPLGGTRQPRPAMRAASVILHALIALNALAAGAAMMGDPSGAGLGMTPALLAPSPFDTFFVPGLVLFLALGLGQASAAILVARRHALAPRVATLTGALLVGWVCVQWFWLAEPSWLQPVCLSIGLAQIVLGFHLVRRSVQRIDGRRISALLAR